MFAWFAVVEMGPQKGENIRKQRNALKPLVRPACPAWGVCRNVLAILLPSRPQGCRVGHIQVRRTARTFQVVALTEGVSLGRSMTQLRNSKTVLLEVRGPCQSIWAAVPRRSAQTHPMSRRCCCTTLAAWTSQGEALACYLRCIIGFEALIQCGMKCNTSKTGPSVL